MGRVSLTRLRQELPRWVRHVQEPEGFVVLTSHEREVAAMISMANLKLLWNTWDEHRIGPIDPATGRPFGREWVVQHFQGHYDRRRDPRAYLRPSREEAPWLGDPFDWPPRHEPKAMPPAAQQKPLPPRPPEPKPPAEPEAPAPARRWWRFW